MAKLLVWLSTLVLVISCTPHVHEHKEEPKASESTPNATATPIKDISSNDGIRFDFSAKWLSEWEYGKEWIIAGEKRLRAGTIEIDASLYNDNADTVYFLSSNCDGDQYRLWYDTTKLDLYPLRLCNVKYRIIRKIPPKGQYSFQAHFKADLNTTKIKVGFYFYQFDKQYDLRKLKLFTIHDRYGYMYVVYGEAGGKIVWADEKIIQERGKSTSEYLWHFPGY